MPAAGDPAGLLAGKGIFRDELFAGSGPAGTDRQGEVPTSSSAPSDTAAGQAAPSIASQQDQSRSQQAGSTGADAETEELLLQEPNPFSGDPTPGPFSHRRTPSSSEALTRQAHAAQEEAAQQLGPREQVGNPKPFIQGNEGPDIGPHQANRKGIIARARRSGQGAAKGSGAAGPAPGGGRSGAGPAAGGAGSQASGTEHGSGQAAQQASRGFGTPKAKRAQAVKKKKGRLAEDVVPGGLARLSA